MRLLPVRFYFVILAIGHSTNLIGKESNVIVVRGGGARGRPVYQQMLAAVGEYFPESGILEEPGVMTLQEMPSSDSSATDLSAGLSLRRVNTGVSSIVGNNNGDRPGGFVLVIDGNALEHVSLHNWLEMCNSELFYTGIGG